MPRGDGMPPGSKRKRKKGDVPQYIPKKLSDRLEWFDKASTKDKSGYRRPGSQK